jgi:hypothetical protein
MSAGPDPTVRLPGFSRVRWHAVPATDESSAVISVCAMAIAPTNHWLETISVRAEPEEHATDSGAPTAGGIWATSRQCARLFRVVMVSGWSGRVPVASR